MLEILEWIFGIAALANKSQAWEAVLRSLVISGVIVGFIIHFLHRRATNLAERERNLAYVERDHATAEQGRAEQERDRQAGLARDIEGQRSALQRQLIMANATHEEAMSEARERETALTSRLNDCAKEMASTNGPGRREIWDRDEQFGVRIILISREHNCQLDGDLAFPGKPTSKEWRPHVTIPLRQNR